MVTIILMQPENPGNIGAVARCMANFGLSDLVLIDPPVDHRDETALCRAKHAAHILQKARVTSFKELSFSTLIATTAKTGSDYNIIRTPLEPEQVMKKIASIDNEVGILFGREGRGLTNKEISACDFLMKIPASTQYPTLNISHAVSVVCYEYFKNFGKPRKFRPISDEEKKYILRRLNNILERMDFATQEKRITQKRFWKRLLGKSFLTKREAYIMFGFLKKVQEHLKE